MDDNWLTDWLTDLLIDYKIVITKSVIIPAVSGLYRPTGLLFHVKHNMIFAMYDLNVKHEALEFQLHL